MTADIRRPFALGADLKRVDDTPLHKALREALANALVHADYQARTSTVITRRNDFVKFANAGTLLLPKEVAMSGGLSETRNPTLMKMFNLLAIGEKAGSGFDAMRQGCRWAGLPDPVLEEELAPDRVILSVQTCGEQTRKRVAFAALESDAFGGDFETVDLSNAEAVLMRMSYTGSIKRKDVEDLLLVSSATAKNILADLVRQGKVLKEGKGRSTRYRLPKS
ncbi:MAG: hypothetical protein IJC51_05005 [Eggerthellaceae bacterium]|nr:hypothetical protein [Eggerthellaceae bacterium]